MRSRLRRLALAAAAVTVLVTACSNDGSGDGGDGTGTPTGASQPPEAKPSDTTGPIKDAALAAGSVVVTRTTTEARNGKDADVTHEEIEVEFTEPPSGRVLHVGEEIWTLNVVDGVGYLKDQSEKKSTNRWQKLDAAETSERFEDATLDGLLGVLDSATKVAKSEAANVRGAEATCHALTLGPSPGASAGPLPQSARVCVDADRRPVELVVTADDDVTTSVFSSWGVAIEAMPPPANLVD